MARFFASLRMTQRAERVLIGACSVAKVRRSLVPFGFAQGKPSPWTGEGEGYFALHSRATKPCYAGWG